MKSYVRATYSYPKGIDMILEMISADHIGGIRRSTQATTTLACQLIGWKIRLDLE